MIPGIRISLRILETPPPTHNIGSNVLSTKIWASPELRQRYFQARIDAATRLVPRWNAGSDGSSTRQCPAPPGQPVCGWLEREVFRSTRRSRHRVVDPRTPHSDEGFEQSIAFSAFARERALSFRAYIASVPPE